jgi:cytochrome c-type biogenesis protein CcmH/NrfF
MSKTSCAVAALVVLLLLASPATAGPEEVANDIAAKVMSPFCPGVTLHDCSSAAALALRDRIERWARQGQSEDQILARLETEYGVAIFSSPSARDGGWLAWALPGAGLLVGLVLGWLLLKRWTSRAATRGAPEGLTGREEVGERDRRRLERELAMLRSER